MQTLLLTASVFSSCCARQPLRIAPPRANATQSAWVDLHPQMEIHIQNACYRDGAPKHGIDGYLGTETARFQVRARGIRLLAVENLLKPHPREQPPVQELIPESQRWYADYRYFYAIVFNHRGNIRGSVLLGGGSLEELDRLGATLLTDPDSICSGPSSHCTVFPEMCTVSIEIEIIVNGVPRSVLSGSLLASIVSGAHQIEVLRHKEGGGLLSMKIDSAEPGALRIPLIPGDRITWN